MSHRIRKRGLAIAVIAASAMTLLATTGTSAQAAGDQPFTKHSAQIPVGAVKTNSKPEKLGSHGPKFSTKQASTRIAGGMTANSSDFPGVVGVVTHFEVFSDSAIDYDTITCSGTLISPTKVLTAATCVTNPNFGASNIQVIAGRNSLSDTTHGTVYGVSNVWTDQGFNIGAQYDDIDATSTDDVAVLTLQTPADPAYVPYNLVGADDTSSYQPGVESVIAGYGTEGGIAVESGVLHTVQVPVASDSQCQTAATNDGKVYDPNRMICAGVPASSAGGQDGAGACHSDQGGPLLVNGKEAAMFDWTPSTGCVSSYGYYERMSYYHDSVMADVNRTNMPVNLDFSGDGHADLMFTDSGHIGEIDGTGLMVTYSNKTAGGISAVFDNNGRGWDSFSKLFRVTNWDGDHTESIFAMTPAGDLYQYRTNGHGALVGPRRLIGTSWSMFTDVMVTNNWLGDGRPNLMGRKANGDLVLYTSNGAGGWTNSHGTLIGTGWNGFNTIITPGNWRGQGQALIGRAPNGELKLYESNGHGGWLDNRGVYIGSGWNGFATFLSPGDWNGDNLIDLIGVAANGDMKLFRTNGSGGWLNGHGDPMTGGKWSSGRFAGYYIF